MKANQLLSLGLTTARAEIIARASKRENGVVFLSGFPIKTQNALVGAGYISLFLVHTPDGIKDLEANRDMAITEARRALCENDSWELAHGLLSNAVVCQRNAGRTEYRLTEKGWAFAREWKAS